MRARARLVVEGGRVRELRSQAPLTLIPRRGAAGGPVTVHLVGSAANPLGGDDLELDVEVGPGAELTLTGVAAMLALPGPDEAPSRFAVRMRVADGGSLRYLPEPTVVTRRANHRGELHVELGSGSRLRCREVLVAGRSGEDSGRFRGLTRVLDGGRPLLAQEQDLGDPALQASAAHLAGQRVLATEVLVSDEPTEAAVGEGWWRSPLPGRGYLATAIGPDAVTTQRALAQAAGRSW